MALVAVFGSDITICGAQGILTSECRHYDCGWMRSDIAIANTARCHWAASQIYFVCAYYCQLNNNQLIVICMRWSVV